MSKIVGYIAQSLDGFIADENHKVAWLEAYQSINYGAFTYEAFIANIGTVIMGRKTYEFISDAVEDWPYTDQRSIVITSSPLPEKFDNIEVYNGSVMELANQLKTEEKDTWIVGGGQLQSTMIAQGLIDEIEFYVMPIMIGKGVPLWPGIQMNKEAKLIDVRHLDAGVVRMHYSFDV